MSYSCLSHDFHATPCFTAPGCSMLCTHSRPCSHPCVLLVLVSRFLGGVDRRCRRKSVEFAAIASVFSRDRAFALVVYHHCQIRSGAFARPNSVWVGSPALTPAGGGFEMSFSGSCFVDTPCKRCWVRSPDFFLAGSGVPKFRICIHTMWAPGE